MERAEELRSHQGTLSDRSLLQADQADLEAGRFPGPLGQRGTLAGVDRPFGVCAAALSESDGGVGAQLHAAHRGGAGSLVGEGGCGGSFAKFLWEAQVGVFDTWRGPNRRISPDFRGRGLRYGTAHAPGRGYKIRGGRIGTQKV